MGFNRLGGTVGTRGTVGRKNFESLAALSLSAGSGDPRRARVQNPAFRPTPPQTPLAAPPNNACTRHAALLPLRTQVPRNPCTRRPAKFSPGV